MRKYILSFLTLGLISFIGYATPLTEDTDSITAEYELKEVVVANRAPGVRKLKGIATNTDVISSGELKRAACCNLGESFTTNPSVDVNYSDAATGAKQVKLLGLPGTYVQMLTESVPTARGAAAQYGLGYIPGPWMQSIQVSKGTCSVKNGYESVTINVEMLKPQADQSLAVNMFGNSQGRAEANVSGNIYLSDKWSTGLLLHGENSFASHDSNNDGFADMPKVRQFSAMDRWAYFGQNYIFQAAIKYLNESRRSGQIGHHAAHLSNPYLIDVATSRAEAFVKNAYIFDPEHNGNVALILSGSLHNQKSNYGQKTYNVYQKNLYASLMLEREFGQYHSLSTGLSLNVDDYNQSYRLINDPALPLTKLVERETTPGAYAQYTYNYDSRLVVMAGLRYDHSSRYGSMVTPRVHARWNITRPFALHASAGKGYRTPFALADNSYLLASGRQIVIDDNLRQEEAWNTGGGFGGEIDMSGRSLIWNAEYYYTDFRNQTVVNLDTSPDIALIENIRGKSFSHTVQLELTFKPIEDLSLMAAYRYNNVKVDYGNGLVDKPLTSKSKALFSVNYAPMMGIWQFDVTLALNGSGRMPTPRFVDGQQLWPERYKAFPTLNLQATRNFRHWAVYVGGENLTGYRQKSPIIAAHDPWGENFDATMIYGPLHGAVFYAGFRYTITKY